MLVLQHKIATLVLPLCLLSCLPGKRSSFQIVRGAQSYLLLTPNRHETQFANILRDYNGFEPGNGWINLTRNMEVRVENAYYQAGSSRRGLDGFLGTEVARYAVNEGGLRLESTVPMKGRPTGDAPVQDLISAALTHARIYRLYFEIVFNRTTNSHGSVLLGADTAEQLEGLAAGLKQPEAICGPSSLHCAAFPEACSVSIEMRLLVNGKREARDWGSLLASVVGQHPRHLELRRWYAGRLIPVRVDVADQAALRLPLLPGDQIIWQ